MKTLLAGIAAGALLLLPPAVQADSAAPAYAVTDRLAIPDGGFDYVSFDPVLRRIYVSRGDGVTALDVDSGKLTGHFADGARTHEPLPVNGGRQVLLTNGGTNSARLLDAANGALVADIPTAEKPDAAIFDPASGLVLVMTHSGAITLVDPKSQKPVGAIAVGGALEFAAADGHGHAWVNVEDTGDLVALDVGGQKVAARYPLKGCTGPSGLAYDDATGLLVVACANNVAKIIKAADGSEVASLAIGAGPDSVILDAGRRLAFVPCGRDGVISVIALRGPTDVAVAATITTQRGARTGAVDPKTGKLYLPTATYTMPEGGGRPQPTPGSFQLLVVSPQ
ncbi:MAG: YncE family protein [Caulobacterales bacterium]